MDTIESLNVDCAKLLFHINNKNNNRGMSIDNSRLERNFFFSIFVLDRSSEIYSRDFFCPEKL